MRRCADMKMWKYEDARRFNLIFNSKEDIASDLSICLQSSYLHIFIFINRLCYPLLLLDSGWEFDRKLCSFSYSAVHTDLAFENFHQ